MLQTAVLTDEPEGTEMALRRTDVPSPRSQSHDDPSLPTEAMWYNSNVKLSGLLEYPRSKTQSSLVQVYWQVGRVGARDSGWVTIKVPSQIPVSEFRVLASTTALHLASIFTLQKHWQYGHSCCHHRICHLHPSRYVPLNSVGWPILIHFIPDPLNRRTHM